MKTFAITLTSGYTGHIPAQDFLEDNEWLRFYCGDVSHPVASYPREMVTRVTELVFGAEEELVTDNGFSD
jgi:hypothetical protein